MAWMRQGAKIPGASMRQVDVNGQPGALMLDGGERVISVMSLDIADGQVQGIRSIVNPEKLGHVGPVADVRALLKRQPVSRGSSRRSPSG
jgi:RNA polymerase sigma-70 factor (ECF subfamily)